MAPRTLADAAAIGTSTLCLVHCLMVPSLLALAPWLVPGVLADERFHAMAALAALPISALALSGALRAHPTIVGTAAFGLALLFLATTMHEALLETSLTVTGALMVVLAHVRNLQLRAGV